MIHQGAQQVDLAIAAGASSAATAGAGIIFGVEYAVIGLALLGGATSLIYIAKMSVWRMIASIFGSTVLGVIAAALFTSIGIAIAIEFAPYLAPVLRDAHAEAKMLIAFCVGFCAQMAVPVFFAWLEKRGGKWST